MILTDPEWQAVLLSLKVSSLAVLLSLPFGIYRWCYRPWSSVTYY